MIAGPRIYLTRIVGCAGISGVHLAGESPVAEGVPAPPYSESCVAGGNKSDEA